MREGRRVGRVGMRHPSTRPILKCSTVWAGKTHRLHAGALGCVGCSGMLWDAVEEIWMPIFWCSWGGDHPWLPCRYRHEISVYLCLTACALPPAAFWHPLATQRRCSSTALAHSYSRRSCRILPPELERATDPPPAKPPEPKMAPLAIPAHHSLHPHAFRLSLVSSVSCARPPPSTPPQGSSGPRRILEGFKQRVTCIPRSQSPMHGR